MSKVITISREFGSGGHEIGFRLSKLLGIPCYDKELISMAAEHGNLSEELFHPNNEVLGTQDSGKDDYIVKNPFASNYEIPVSDQVFIIQSRVISKLAQEGPCVIIGRCSDSIVEDGFNVFITAPIKKRVERLMQIDKTTETDPRRMEARVRQIDKKRQEYYQFYTGNEWGKPRNYHLCLNSSKLGIENCVKIIASCYEAENADEIR